MLDFVFYCQTARDGNQNEHSNAKLVFIVCSWLFTTSVREGTREHRKFCWLLCLGAALAAQRVGVPGKVLWGVGEWPKKTNPHLGAPQSWGAASALSYPATISQTKASSLCSVVHFRTELQLMRSAKMEFDSVRIMLKSKINLQCWVHPGAAGVGSTGHGGRFWQLLTETTSAATLCQALDMQTQHRVLTRTRFLLVFYEHVWFLKAYHDFNHYFTKRLLMFSNDTPVMKPFRVLFGFFQCLYCEMTVF